MSNVVYEQTLFVTSDESANGLSFAPLFNIPPTFLTCKEHQRIRLELNSFTIDRACWFNVHQNCSLFFIKTIELGVEYYTYARINNGNRLPHDGTTSSVVSKFIAAFNYATTTTGGTPMDLWTLTGGSWSPVTRKYVFVPAYTGFDTDATMEVICLNLPDSRELVNLPVGLLAQVKKCDQHYLAGSNSGSSASFQDTYKLLGTYPTTDPSNIISAFYVNASGHFQSPFPSKDETNQNIYIRLDQPNDNIQSQGHNPISKANPSNMELSSIIGKIPIPRWLPLSADDQTSVCPLITADSDTSRFSMNLYSTYVPSMQITITDAEGRRFPFAAYDRFSGLFKFFNFEMSFKVSLTEDRIETMKRQLIFQSEMLEKIAEIETSQGLASAAELKLNLMNMGNE